MAEAKTVVLLDPDGNKYTASHPADITSLVYGAGYRIEQKGLTPEKAVELLATKGIAADDLAPAVALPPEGGKSGK